MKNVFLNKGIDIYNFLSYDKNTRQKIIQFIKEKYNFIPKQNNNILEQIKENKHKINNEIKEKHLTYYNNINRFASSEEIKNDIINFNFVDKRIELLKNSYFLNGFDKNLSYIHKKITEIMYLFMKNLYYYPSNGDIKLLITENIDTLNFITSKDDYKYLEECRIKFNNLTENNTRNINKKFKIKYYGPIGKSGYAKMTRNIIKSLNSNIDIYFEPLQFHNFNINSISDEDYLLSELSKNIINDYSYVVIHSTPECWVPIAKYEKLLNPKCKIYCISVWELEILPSKWLKYIHYADKISVPSEFSAISFKKEFKDVDIIHHPIFIENTKIELCKINKIKKKYNYVFYNISEWTNRKGIDDLIISFDKLNLKDCALYIKTFGDINEKEARNFLIKYNKNNNIFIDYDNVSDNYINCIHECGDCYVSLTKTEGHGIGACEAVLHNNNVIITNYSGHLDYLKNIDLIDYHLIPSSFCSVWSEKHKNCNFLPHCKNFDLFIPYLHKWAQPHIDHTVELMKINYLTRKKGNKKSKGFIEKNFNLKITNKKFYKSIKTTKLKSFNKNLILKSFNKLENIELQNYYFTWNLHKKRILILSAGNIGNVGDQYINDNITNFFNDDYEVINIVDNCFIDKNYNLILSKDFNDNIVLLSFDFLIIGGGGIFRKNKSSSIFKYTDICIEQNIPYYIIGIGFQDNNYNDYSKVLNNANFISVRSITDYTIAEKMLVSNSCLYCFPDLGYINNFLIEPEENNRKYLAIIPTETWANPLKHNCIKDYINKNKDLTVIFINFGGYETNDIYNIEHENIINGIKINCDFNINNKEQRDYTIIDIYKILSETKILITGRYHGTILGKLAKIPIIETFNYNNHKFNADIISNYNLLSPETLHNLSLEQLKYTKILIDNNIVFNYKKWSSDDRNKYIIECNKLSNLDITLLQNWSNYTLEKYFKFYNLEKPL